jgi:hypothetical protein
MKNKSANLGTLIGFFTKKNLPCSYNNQIEAEQGRL